MEQSDIGLTHSLSGSITVIVNDPRTGPSHISLYLAILFIAAEQEFNSPISIFSRDLMKRAKISSAATYRKCMNELKEIGLINYVPSCNPFLGSLVYVLCNDN